MGIDHDQALARLPEDLGQAHRGNHAGGDHVTQHGSRPHRRQLIDVTHQDQASPRGQRRDQIRGQPNIQHGRLVHHQQVRLERTARGAREDPLGGLPLEQPVQGRGRLSGRLGESLGRATGRGRQRHAQPLAREYRHDAPHDGRLAHPRAPRHDQHPLRQGAAHRLGLLGGEGDVGFPLVPGQRAIDVDGGRLDRCLQQAPQPTRHRHLGAVQGGHVDRLAARWPLDGVVRARADLRAGLDDHVARPAQPLHRRIDQVLADAEQRDAIAHQTLAGQEDVPVGRGLLEHVAHACLGPTVRLAPDPQGSGQLVGRQETDPPDIEGQAIGILADQRHGVRAVALVDAGRERR